MALAEQTGWITPSWTLGDRIRKAREIAELSQHELAAQIGVSPQAVSKWEASEAEPRRMQPVIATLARVSGVDPLWIAGLTEVTPGAPGPGSQQPLLLSRRRHLQLCAA